jgi:PAS domain S-box-containing protein
VQTLSNLIEENLDLLHILVIDDDEVDQMAIKRSLGKTTLSTRVYAAHTGSEALELLQTKTFDCIFLDFMLPDMNGLELLEEIRSRGIQSPLLIITSQGDEQIAVKAIRLGAADYIPKSFLTPEGIYHSIRNAIRIQRAETQRQLTAERLTTTQSQLNLLVSNLPMGIWNIDEQGFITYINGKVLELLGLEPLLMTGKHISEAYKGYPEIIDRITNALAGETIQAIIEIEENFFRSVNVPTLNQDGKVIGVSGFAFDITENVHYERALLSAKELAEQSVKIKEQFIANISHEIRTPMNGIIGLSKVLQNTHLDQDQKKYLRAIQTSADNLMIIINDLLDFSKMSAQHLTLDNVNFNLYDLANDIILLMKPRAEERSNSLTLDFGKDVHQVLSGDSLRLRQILLNLIGNAVKFTEKGHIKLLIRLNEDYDQKSLIEFVVDDTGIGIPEEKLDAIFESFNQGSNDTTRIYGGTGLGLTISKNLVELQGGTIEVRSKPMAGSTFRFILPFEKKSPIPEQVEETVKQLSQQSETVLSLKILLAEDNEINQLLINKVLSDWNFESKAVANGKEAIDLIQQEHFDLILMDMQMPVMDGYEAIAHIREMESAKRNIPIISLTAYAAESEIKKCLDAGANAYLSKPFDQQELYQIIQRLVAK